MFFVEEPERGQAEKEAGAKMEIQRTSYLKDVLYLIKQWACVINSYFFSKTYIFATLAFTAVTFVTGTLAFWAPSAVKYAYCSKEDLYICHKAFNETNNNPEANNPADFDLDSNIYKSKYGLIYCFTITYFLALISSSG